MDDISAMTAGAAPDLSYGDLPAFLANGFDALEGGWAIAFVGLVILGCGVIAQLWRTPQPATN